MTENGSNRTTKSKQNQNARRKGNLEKFGNIGSGCIKQTEMKKIKIKNNTSGERENYSTPDYIAEIS